VTRPSIDKGHLSKASGGQGGSWRLLFSACHVDDVEEEPLPMVDGWQAWERWSCSWEHIHVDPTLVVVQQGGRETSPYLFVGDCRSRTNSMLIC
jgi:hypothetical protein